MNNTYFNWSTGKDSALALFYLLQGNEHHITKLVTTVNKDFDRVSMHGLREGLLDLQADSIGLPLQKVYLPATVSMSAYDKEMKKLALGLVEAGYGYAAFGDIFLEDLRQYRESKLAEVGLKTIFPLWKKDTKQLLLEFLALGFKAITVCANAKLLDESFVGRELDESFINELPTDVDPCGENGEFHTFVYDGPIFKHPIEFEIGEKVLRTYAASSEDDGDNCFSTDTSWDTSFWYCDLLPMAIKQKETTF